MVAGLSRFRLVLTGVGVAVLLAGGLVAQVLLRRHVPGQAASTAQGVFAAIGGLRSIAAEVIWFRADRLQEEGRYVELAQLASALTLMEPHTPEVWSYAAWNLAYNVSVMMATDEDRWRWVQAAIHLLRDEGLRLNPREAELYHDLAWMFEIKIGAHIDSAAPTYRAEWRKLVADVKRRGAWDELRLEPAKMLQVEQAVGSSDWGDPQLSAIYWAAEGLRYADDRMRPLLLEIIRQAQAIRQRSVTLPH